MARDNSGSLSKNEKKLTEKHPDFRGSCEIDGKPFWISGWAKENERGKWISLSFTPKEVKKPDGSEVPF